MALQRQGLGLWADVDVIALRPVALDGPFVAGRESERFLNGTVLRLDPDSAMLRDWVAATENGRVPPWVRFHRAPAAYLRQALGARIAPAELPFGTFGPKLITALAELHGLTAAAQPIEVFYPLHPRDATRLWDPTLKLAEVVTERTLTIHLWNEKLKAHKHLPPPEGSILWELLRRYRE
jgi:hypothetical protein